MAGSGSEASALAAAARSLGVQGSVDLLGFVDDVGALMRSAGLLLATAPAEPLGLTVLEAMSFGLPVIAAAAGGHLETVGAVPGAALFPPTDDTACAVLLARLAADVDERHRYGDRCRQVQRADFSLLGHVERLREVYAT